MVLPLRDPRDAGGRRAEGSPAGIAAPSGVPPKELSLLAQRACPAVLAREALLPLPPALAELVGAPGLRRGATVSVGASSAPGATSLVLSFLAAPSAAGCWCAVVGHPDLGLLAVEELGVALERLVLVPEPGRRFATVTAALLEGCELVLARVPSGLRASEARRLSARARERRAVLLLTGPGVGEPLPSGGGASGPHWPERPEVELRVLSCSFGGLRRGSGRLTGQRLEVEARRRRAVPEEVRRTLLLPVSAGLQRGEVEMSDQGPEPGLGIGRRGPDPDRRSGGSWPRRPRAAPGRQGGRAVLAGP